MGTKANPIANRLGIIRGWDSNWYGGKDFSDKLIEDQKIRKYLNARIQKGGISKIIIERTLNRITISINTARPGIIIGKGGGEVDRIKEEIKKLTKKDVQINIVEIRRPEVDAAIVGETVCKQLEARVNFRRAEIARTESYKEGRTPLHTFRADIDYAWKEAETIYGKIGVKVWICKGEILTKRDLTPNVGMDEANKKGGGSSERRGSDRRDDRRGGGNDRRGGAGKI